MKYINRSNPINECIFCMYPRQVDGPGNLIVVRGERAYVIMNRYPYTNGHLMVVPFTHVASLELLDAEERAGLMELTSEAVQVIRAVYHPEGFNVGINIGKVAGAGVADHVHIHIVPRWGGDTNFMSAVGQTRVLPEALEDTYQRMVDGWNQLRSQP